MRIVIAIVVFSILILFHELGHFWLAKKNGIIVDEFSLGMGPRILSFTKNGTKYSLKIFPFGGSCAMRGEDGEEEEPGSFNAASIWGRISVVAAGPIFNFILAFVIAIIIVGAVGYDTPEVMVVREGSAVATAGLLEGDVITKFQGKRIAIGRDLYNIENLSGVKAEETIVEFIRDGEKQTINYLPDSIEQYMVGITYAGEDPKAKAEVWGVSIGSAMAAAGILPQDVITSIDGIAIDTAADLSKYFEENPLTGEELQIIFERDGKSKETSVVPIKTLRVDIGFGYNINTAKTTPLGVVRYALEEMRFWVDTTFQTLKMFVTGRVSVSELSGPIGVIDVIGDTYESGKEQGALVTWMMVLQIMLLMSVNLGIMNLLPLPALDGGRLIFLLIEAVRGKPTNRKVEGTIHFIGIILLLSLMVYVTFNDILKLF